MSPSWMIVVTALLAIAGVAAVARWQRRRGASDADPPPPLPAAEPTDARSLPTRAIDEALRITGGSREVADMLIADMLGSLPDQLTEAAGTLAQEDWIRLREVTHRIKGATAVCAVPALHHAVCELQRVAREADAARARSWLDRVEVERQRLVAEQRDHLSG